MEMAALDRRVILLLVLSAQMHRTSSGRARGRDSWGAGGGVILNADIELGVSDGTDAAAGAGTFAEFAANRGDGPALVAGGGDPQLPAAHPPVLDPDAECAGGLVLSTALSSALRVARAWCSS